MIYILFKNICYINNLSNFKIERKSIQFSFFRKIKKTLKPIFYTEY